MSREYGVGLALDLMSPAGDTVSDDGAALVHSLSVRGCRFVIESSSSDPVASDQEVFVHQFRGRVLVEECRHDVVVDAVEGISQKLVSGAQHRQCCTVERDHRIAPTSAVDVEVQCVIEDFSSGKQFDVLTVSVYP
ncbi:hypothetical protein BDB13_5862 [Rhodococcus sp. OK302]|nr:hypothetical protein BDB13_5862 [Rhodococcus sp. OK302]